MRFGTAKLPSLPSLTDDSDQPWPTRVRGLWRRSLQLRVVTTTIVLTTAVTSLLVWYLLETTRDGLVEARVAQVVAEAEAETSEARSRLGYVTGSDDAAAQQLDVVQPIIDRGAVRGYAVVLSAGQTQDGVLRPAGTTYSQHLDTRSVPASLQRAFAGQQATSWTFTDIRADGPLAGVSLGPGIALANQVRLPADGRTYTLYYLFPLAEQDQTLDLVKRSLLTAAGFLAVLAGAVSWVVTRQVVTPVRMTRRVAERLAAGQLQERLQVRGEDDLARLAESFNQMASNLQRQILQLEELSRMQRRFVSDVSHELRTPLTTVRMAGDLLHDARDGMDPVSARAAELLHLEIERFETLLADLLEISRFDAGAAVLEIEDVDLAVVARSVVESTEPLARQRNVTVHIRTSVPAVAEADVRRVERILRNLVTNAIDHAEGGDVVITLGSDADATALTVRDHGVGLGPGESAMVFNRFWRADPARARTSGGTGLGLPIALEDARLHGGWLQAWGRRGEGAQFRLTLPRRQGEPLRHSPLPLVPISEEEM